MSTCKLYSIILDLGYPMELPTLESILMALENVLTLAWCSKSHNESHSIIMCVINQEVENLGVFSMKGDYKKIQALIGEIKSTGKTNWRLTAEEYEDSLHLAITTAMNEYKLKVNSDYGGMSGRMRIAVVSGKPSKALGHILCSIRRRWANFKAEGAAIADVTTVDVAPDIAAIQVIYTCVRRDVHLGWPNESGDLQGDILMPKIIIERAISTNSIQDELKRFLMVPDAQVLKIVISAETITSSKIAEAVDDSGTVVICEATPVTMDPNDLPVTVAHNFLIPASEEDKDKGKIDYAQPENPGKLARCLIIKSRVSYDGVCDGSIFGMPFYLSPISPGVAASLECLGTKTSSDIDQNIQMFWAMHQQLTEREEVLVTSMESDVGTGGNFLIYAGGDCLLLQALQSEELALPASIEALGSIRKNVSPNMALRMGNILNPLPRKKLYSPSDYPTGVFPHLSSLVKKTVQKSASRKKAAAKQNSMILSFLSQKDESTKSKQK